MRLRRILALLTFVASGIVFHAAEAEALLVVLGDQHSAYDRTAQVVALVDRLRLKTPDLPVAVLLNGDTMEWGNVIARRSHGAIDFQMMHELASRVPTFLNLGNHEPEFYDVAETVKRVRATGVVPLSNLRERGTGRYFTDFAVRLKLGRIDTVLVGITTDRLGTFRVAVRPQLDPYDPAVWGRANLPTLAKQGPLIVMSHAGLDADRELLTVVPDGTLFAGAHDHLRFVHQQGRSVYFHSGCWNSHASLVWLRRGLGGALLWTVEQVEIGPNSPADVPLAEFIAATRKRYVEPDDLAAVGKLSHALSPADAASYVVEALRDAAQVDAAFIGNTTFGAGLPAGPVSRLAFDACIRFDGSIFTTEIDGVQLREIVARANQTINTSFSERQSGFLVAVAPSGIAPDRRYRIATTDWGARNSLSYFGAALKWQEMPGLKLKPLVIAALQARAH
ncbi:MAG: metallophosphoesterase [Opitutae bacterium]|nr:metallophosphoesterase [Opitutae bacterium]